MVKRLNEYIDAMRALWTQDKASFHGEFANFDNCISRPRPVNGTVPIVIGGHTKAAARRAGERGDAFFPGSATAESIAELVDVMKQTAAEHDRDGDAIRVYAMAIGKPGDSMYARIDALAGVGVDQVIVPAYSPSRLVGIGEDLLARFA